MKDVAIIGVGLHPWGKFPDKPWTAMAKDAIDEAMKDAGVQWKDIGFIVSGSQLWGGRKGIYSGTYTEEVMGNRGIPVVNVNNACATGGTMLTVAAMAVASGAAEIVLAVSSDKSAKGFFPALPVYHEEPVPSDDTLRWNLGLPNPVYWALEMRKRMTKFGDTEEHLAKVKVTMSKHGKLNPKARYQREFSLEEVLNSAMVTDPLRLYEICATSDGAGAAILCSKEKAKQFTSKPIDHHRVGSGQPALRRPDRPHPRGEHQPETGRAGHQRELGGGAPRVRRSRRRPRGHRLRGTARQQRVARAAVHRDHGLLQRGRGVRLPRPR